MFLNSSTLPALRFFEAAARHLSFKNAALELHVTQGAMSQQIKHLERALGCTLFLRMTRQIKLTDEGERLAAVVTRALGDLEREVRAMAGAAAFVDIKVRVGPSFALRWLVPRLAAFYSQYPQIKLFVNGAYGYFNPAQHEFDIAIEMVRGKTPSLKSEVLMDEYLFPVCSPAYLAQHSALKKPNNLTKCTLLHDAHPWVGDVEDAEWRYWLQRVEAGEVDSRQGLFFTLSNMTIEAALTHQGVAMGRACLVRDLLDSGLLVAPFKDRIRSPAQYQLLYPKELAERPEIQIVLRWLHQQASSSPPALR
jgi:LysR family transcriptional regulator, glycine cleavage system transcriptional activator